VKLCVECKDYKDFKEFDITNKKTYNLKRRCRTCQVECNKEQQKKDRKYRKEKRFLRAAQGMNETARELGEAFTGKCYICEIHEIDCKVNLSADHCHKTGSFRGWLCGTCNAALGFFNDSVELLEKAILYLNSAQKNRKR
jgi:hypothetical protein